MSSVTDVLKKLNSLSDAQRKKNLVKLGIPEENSIGVSTGDIRQLAKKYPKDDLFARELWDTKIHEAKLLAVLLLVPKESNNDKINYFMNDIFSWDLCDHFCKNYLIKTKNYTQYIEEWVSEDRLYYKRAAFTLIASQTVKDKQIAEQDLEKFLSYIEEFSSDNRVHVYKAIAWALREIGKVNLDLQEKAIVTAYNLCESSDMTKQKIGKDALKELESLVQVEGRTRLISSKSKMAKL